MARSLKKGPYIHYKLQKKVDKLNCEKPFVEFPIHLMHEDIEEEFISPLKRELKSEE